MLPTFLSLSDHWRTGIGCGDKVYKITVPVPGTCPNRDGSIGTEGCAFCDEHGSASFHSQSIRTPSITENIQKTIPALEKRFHAKKFAVYFQSYTVTYGDGAAERLERIIQESLSADARIVGVNIGARPDCLPDSVIEVCRSFSNKTHLTVEMGIQSLHDSILNWLKRGHDSECALSGIERVLTRLPEADLSLHFILGCPEVSGETSTSAQEYALALASLLAKHSSSEQKSKIILKLHQLMILKNTPLAKLYRHAEFDLPSIENYAEKVKQFLSTLAENTFQDRLVIDRLYALASNAEDCIAPSWSRERWRAHNVIRAVLGTSSFL